MEINKEDEVMSKEELFFENETRKHQQEVSNMLIWFANKLLIRATKHDDSKLKEPERSIFIKYTPKLKNTTYGSDEYKKYLKEMKVALNHHYAKNKHHPEFNDINGFSFQTLNDPIRSMNLLDIVEMLFDWYAATKRHADGDIEKSISNNEKRFGINNQLSQIFRNTIGFLTIENEDKINKETICQLR